MKKVLLSLFGIITLCSINFGSCLDVIGLTTNYQIPSTNINNSSWTTIVDMGTNIYDGNRVMCISLFPGCNNVNVGFSDIGNGDAGGAVTIWKNWNGSYICINRGTNGVYLKAKGNNCGSDTVYGSYFYLDNLLNQEIPEMSSYECQENYNLIPIESVDSNYCEINGLCPACPEGSGGFSSFYVYSQGRYDELSGTFNYYVNIPDYLDYSYDYSNGGDDLDLDIGIAVDTGYIENINSLQNYKPTSEDFTELIGTLAPYSKILIFCLFIFIIWAWIKKPFKSKKI